MKNYDIAMTLVGYSDSEDDAEQTKETTIKGLETRKKHAGEATLKRKRQERDDKPAQRIGKPAPSLPANFHTLYATQVRTSTSDDPALHGGRQRQVPHVVGNWPSFVYLEWLPAEDDLLVLDQVIKEAASQLQAGSETKGASYKLESSLRSELGVRLPLHISLSSPLTLTTDTKDEFEKGLTKAIQNAGIRTFQIRPSGVRWVSNFDKTRHFLILSLTKPGDDQLQTLLSTCNGVARRFGLTELYGNRGGNGVGVPQQPVAQLGGDKAIVPADANDMFHISIAWTLARPANEAVNIGEESYQRLTGIKLFVGEVLIKIGNAVSTVHLREAATKRT